MGASVTTLPWLPPAPEDFSARLRAVGDAEGDPGKALQQLAGHRLSGVQAASLARTARRLRQARGGLEPLAPFRLGLLPSNTYDLIADGLPAAAMRHGVDLEVLTAPYDQVMQQALDPASPINGAGLDAVLIAVDHRWLRLDRACLGAGGAEKAVEEAVQRVAAVADALSAPAILQTVPGGAPALFGSFDRRLPGSARAMIEAFNRRVAELAAQTGAYLLDVAALAEQIGSDGWFDPMQWHAHKLPFSPACNAAYADWLGRLLGAIRGKARKCLVLDLDNTLWGGVVGDDGLEGLQIGQGAPAGEAFLAVQRLALELKSRGIVLAVSSKNDDAVARRPFREHPDMLLREADLSVFQANWLDKASNLEAVAKALNIGLDALVLLDDNPAERAMVRAALPMVAVPELPADPSWYPWFLSAAGYFEAVAFSAEDASRSESYAADARRQEVQASSRDLGDYLRSLEMVLDLRPFDPAARARIAQLINKTNQFNLTTRRYSEADVAALEADPGSYTLQVRLRDRFGDLGLIAAMVCRKSPADGGAWEVDTWLMSCRVLGRQVEAGMLAKVLGDAPAHGVSRLVGVYRPTAKNGMVSDHYSRLGFEPVGEGTAGERRFVLKIEPSAAADLPFLQVNTA